MKLDLYNLRLHIEDSASSTLPFVPISLLRRFNRETGTCHHIIPIVYKTKSGIKNESWCERMATQREKKVTLVHCKSGDCLN